MHIAQVAPLTEAIPPKLYGGTERVVSWLTEELIALGHEVTLFASGDSVTSAQLDAVWPRALRLDGSVRDPERAAHADAGTGLPAAPAISIFCTSTSTIIPSRCSPGSRRRSSRPCTAVSICPSISRSSTTFPRSRWCRSPMRSGGRCRRHAGCAPCITACRKNCSRRSRSSRLTSRFSAASLPKRASIAPSASPQHCGMPLKVAAKVDNVDREYFDEQIEPMMKSGNVEYDR